MVNVLDWLLVLFFVSVTAVVRAFYPTVVFGFDIGVLFSLASESQQLISALFTIGCFAVVVSLVRVIVLNAYFRSDYERLVSEICVVADSKSKLIKLVAKRVFYSLLLALLFAFCIYIKRLDPTKSFLSYVIFCVATYLAIGAILDSLKFAPLFFKGHVKRRSAK